MLDSFADYFWQHPALIIGAAIAVIIILIWMTGSGSRQRFISFRRSKETEQLMRDVNRIAAALERIARSQETPTDYVGRPIPPGWEHSISSGDPAEDVVAHGPAVAIETESVVPVAAPTEAGLADEPPASDAPTSAPAREVQPSSFTNPLGGTAGLLGGKKKLDLPNPLYRPK